jgi:anti-sigma factor RsiW
MLNCYQFKNHISSYLDGEISLKKRQEFEEHLQNCPHCRQLLAQITHNHHTLHHLPAISVSDNFYFKLRNRIWADKRRQSEGQVFPLFRLKNIPSYAYGFALAFLAVIVSIVILNVQEAESPTTPIPPTVQSRITQPARTYSPSASATQPVPAQASQYGVVSQDSISEEDNGRSEAQPNFQDQIKTVKDQR